ncbi:MAG: glucose-6-phosphate dehydrogenase [Candidatus Paceibacterota bacterium]|jgi:glucose-6-phosphate 1-dehydrogenase
MKNSKPTILIIVGITGDLSKRKLLPAIGQIATTGMIPEQFKILGVTRQNGIVLESLLGSTSNKEYLREKTELFQMNLDEVKDYKKLEDKLDEIEKEFGEKAQYLFYLSVPPVTGKSIIKLIGESGLAQRDGTKLLLEKPFGTDLESAKDLSSHIDKYFKADQIYRIDHYMAKETAQNIIVFREGNSLFKRTWNKDFISRIEVTVSEEIGIEGRANFYEQTGALRDLIQSHLLQLLALTLMDLPKEGEMNGVPELRYEALRQLRTKEGESLSSNTKRGQYKGYREEVGNDKSMVETFASIDLESSDPKWQGVEINLTTGKALKDKFTEIKILYKKGHDHESNELLLRLQPDEGISFSVWAKRPGYEHQVSKHALNFSFKDHYTALPEAYEQVLFNAMNGDHSLFSSSEEVIETWRILDELQKAWATSTYDLIIYKKGSIISEIIS